MFWEKLHLMPQWHPVMNPVKQGGIWKQMLPCNIITLCFIPILNTFHSASVIDCTLISTVKCFIENWFEGLLFLEGQTMGPGDCGYDMEKETEGCLSKHLRHWERDCCRLRCPPQQWAPKALHREILTSCWTELPRPHHRTPASDRGADNCGHTQCWQKVEDNKKHLNIDRKHWVTALPHFGINSSDFCLQNEGQHCELQKEGSAFAQEKLIKTHSAEIWPLQQNGPQKGTNI